MRSLLVLMISVCAALVAPSIADAQTPPDVVRLHDGSFVRGTIVERTPEQVVIMLPTGETRTYPMSAVDFAGPDTTGRMAPAPAAPAGPPPARLRVTTDPDDSELTLQRLAGSATVSVWTGRGAGTAVIDAFDVICNAPCDVELPEGTYQLGISHGTGGAQRAGRPVELRGDMHLHLDYENREGYRIAGWITFIGGSLLGLALITTSIVIDEREINLPMLIGGSVIAGVAYIAFFVLAFMNDHAEIEIDRGTGALRF